MNEKEPTIEERYEEHLANGWRYLPDGNTWSGGVWVHDDLGFVNNGGGSFATITLAVEALDRFLAAIEQMNAS